MPIDDEPDSPASLRALMKLRRRLPSRPTHWLIRTQAGVADFEVEKCELKPHR